MRWRVAALVALTLLAGCSAFGSNGGTATPTLTPAPVPTPDTTATETSDLPVPGVASQGVSDLATLASAHAEAAAEERYVWTERSREDRVYENVTANTSDGQRIVVENETTYRRDAGMIETRRDGSVRFLYNYETYADGTVEYRHWVSQEGTEQFRRDSGPDRTSEFGVYASEAIREYLDVDRTTVSRITVDREPHYRIIGTGGRLPRYDGFESYRAVAVVRPDGFVRSLNVTFVGNRSGERVDASYSFRYTQVGSATVEEPEWASAARAEFGDD